jgi:hypothetical protein
MLPPSRDKLLTKALALADSGIPVFPLLRNKRPATEHGFKDATFWDLAAIERAFSNPDAALIGVPTGPVSGFVVLDIDPQHGGDEWLREHGKELPPTRTHRTRSGGLHFLFNDVDGLRNSAGKIAPGVDIRGDGGYIVWWPASDCEVYADAPIADFPLWLLDRIAAAKAAKSAFTGEAKEAPPRELVDQDLLKRKLDEMAQRLSEAPEGGKHAALCRESVLLGGMMYALDMNADEAAEWLVDHLPDTVADRELARKTALSGLAKGKISPVRVGIAAEFWPPPTPINDLPPPLPDTVPAATWDAQGWNPWERPIPPDFPLDCLPAALRATVADVAERIGTDVGATAMAHLAAVAAAVDGRTSLRVKRHDNDWIENPRLWVMLVGDPSTKKTPLIGAVIRPLREMESRAGQAFRNAHDMWDQTPKAERGAEPSMTRYVMNDSTPEKAAEILAANPRGALLHLDELSGWITGMDRYTAAGKGGAARAFWLQAYNGGDFTQDRVGRGTIFVRNLSVSILGGIQPDRLRDIHGLTDDGLLQRFIPVLMGRATLGEDKEPCAEVAAHNAHLARLLAAPARPLLYLDATGHAEREAAFHWLDDLARPGSLGQCFSTFCGKGAALIMRLAMALHFADPASIAASDGLLPAHTVAQARALMEYVIRNGAAFYRELSGRGGTTETQALASFIVRHKTDKVTLRDFVQSVRCFRGCDERENLRRISVFEGAGWLIAINDRYPCKTWTIAPGLREHFAEQAKEETRRRAQLHELILTEADRRSGRADSGWLPEAA